MITIITGEINSGKTHKMKDLYLKTLSGDGFFCNKVFKNNIHIGYDLKWISDKDSIPFIRKKQFLKETDKTIFTIGNYGFLEQNFNNSQERLQQIIKDNISPIYIDELGPLELQKKCFYKSIVNITNQNIPLITCVRMSCLEQIITLFNFDQYKIIEV